MKKIVGLLFMVALISMSTITFPKEQTDLNAFRSKIQIHLDSLYNEKTDFGGATMAIVLPDGQKCGFAVGYADTIKKIKMKPEDRMLGGSTGKIFVSAAIMQLVEDGKLSLEENISEYLGDLPWFKRVQNHETITIRDLMQHSSGISRYVFEPSFQSDIHINADRIWKPYELLEYVLDKEPLFSAGTEFAYSDTNYILLAIVLEKVSKMSMYEYIDKNILTPFELENISPQVSRDIDGLVVGYNKEDDNLFPGVVLENGIYKYNVQFEWAGGGYVMNAIDLANAGKLIYEGKVFDDALMEDFFQGIDAKRLGGEWGLGVHIKNTAIGKSYGHSGFFPGYITNMLYFPDYKFAIAIQVNTSDGANMGLYQKLIKLIPTIASIIKPD